MNGETKSSKRSKGGIHQKRLGTTALGQLPQSACNAAND